MVSLHYCYYTKAKKLGLHVQVLTAVIFLVLMTKYCNPGFQVQPKHLACISIGCLHIAAKVVEQECNISSTHELIRISQSKFTVSDLSRMEKIISEKLNFQFKAVTALTFLHLYHAIALSHTSDR